MDAFVKNANYTENSGYVIAGYEDFRVGGDVRLSTLLADNLTVSTNYALTWENVYNADPNASLAVKEIQGTAIISSVGYSLLYDTRDNKRKPTRGFYFKGTQDFAGVGGSVDYLRSTADARAYYPITQDIVLAGRMQGGTIAGWGGQGVRVVDAFYKGGETIPGFAPAGFGPRDAATGDALGGTTFYSATTELRFPLPFLPSELGLSGAIFTAAGTSFGTDASKFASAFAAKTGTKNTLAIQDTSALRSSAGGSLIWDLPVGGLRVDFAKVLSKGAGDKTQVVISAIPAGDASSGKPPGVIQAATGAGQPGCGPVQRALDHVLRASTKAARSSAAGIARSGIVTPISRIPEHHHTAGKGGILDGFPSCMPGGVWTDQSDAVLIYPQGGNLLVPLNSPSRNPLKPDRYQPAVCYRTCHKSSEKRHDQRRSTRNPAARHSCALSLRLSRQAPRRRPASSSTSFRKARALPAFDA